jgi:hypothetical protein
LEGFDENLKTLRKQISMWDHVRMNIEARERLVDFLDKYNVRYGKGDEKEVNWQTSWGVFQNHEKPEGERIRGAWRNRRYWGLGSDGQTDSGGGSLKATEALYTLIELFRWRSME